MEMHFSGLRQGGFWGCPGACLLITVSGAYSEKGGTSPMERQMERKSRVSKR